MEITVLLLKAPKFQSEYGDCKLLLVIPTYLENDTIK